MAALTAASVSYSVGDNTTWRGAMSRQPGQPVCCRVTVTFGNGSLTYPSGGVPLTLGKLGTPNVCESIHVIGATPVSGDANPVWKWDGSQLTPKLVAYVLDANTNSDDLLFSEAATTVAPAGQTLLLEATGY